jgi:hypothetical protein
VAIPWLAKQSVRQAATAAGAVPVKISYDAPSLGDSAQILLALNNPHGGDVP